MRAYRRTKKFRKIYSNRLKFPIPAAEETWVMDANGSPVFVVMVEPGAYVAGELRRQLPELRTAVGDQGRILVGFDRGGWPSALSKHMDMGLNGFDVLTWRKGTILDIEKGKLKEVSYTDERGETRTWTVADTLADLTLPTTKKVRGNLPDPPAQSYRTGQSKGWWDTLDTH